MGFTQRQNQSPVSPAFHGHVTSSKFWIAYDTGFAY